MVPSQNDLTMELNRALECSTGDISAYINVRVAVVSVLALWPPNVIHEALIKLLPWGEEISSENRKTLAGLGESVEIFISVSADEYDDVTLEHVLVCAPMLSIM